MVRNAIIETFKDSWPMFVIVIIILASLRITYSIVNKKSISLYKEFIHLGFISYILCLFYIVTFDDVSWSTSNFNLFQEIMRYDFGTRLFFKNVMNNMLMFIPYGFFIAYYLGNKSIKPVLLLTIITSVTIETTQLLIGRVFDVDDILLNIIGGICGYLLYRLLMLFHKMLPPLFKKDWFYNLLSVILLIFIVLYILNIFDLGAFPW